MGKGNAGNYADQYVKEVAFTFGYGLSYTTFDYSNMTVETGINANGEKCYNVTVTVTNTGDVAGKETVQVYLSSPYTQYDIDNKVEKAEPKTTEDTEKKGKSAWWKKLIKG